MKKKWIWLTVIAVSLLLICTACLNVYNHAQKPHEKAKEYAISIAKQESAITSVTDFNIYNSEESYYAVLGQTDKKKQLAVFVPKEKKKQPITKDITKGISKEEAVKKLQNDESIEKLLGARLGIEKSDPVWELVFLDKNDQINYYYLQVNSGEWLKKIKNI
ncbi:cell wall elongation regulator TseB-like domain-containing protein [Bacillus sp. Hm123]|uniref:cell wall elongation regulator TseB-like domain-containing protein n=1 Tax=Bacillus sp. Hm123 TaxID=3450745 RepID=UPI003F442E4B